MNKDLDYLKFIEQVGESADLKDVTKDAIKGIFYALISGDPEFRRVVVDLIEENSHDVNASRLLVKQHVLHHVGTTKYLQNLKITNHMRILLSRAAAVAKETNSQLLVSPEIMEKSLYLKAVELYTMHVLDDYVTHSQLEQSFRESQ